MSERPADRHGRREDRRDLVSFVWYKLLPIAPVTETPTPEGIAHSCDISSTGVGMVIPRPLAEGSWVFLELGLSVGRISAVGRVRHCRAAGGGLFRVGCALDVVPPNDRQAVARVLAPGREA